jgi:hypothetical protein
MSTVRKQIAWAIINQLNGQGPQIAPIQTPVNPTFPTVGRKLPDPNNLSGGEFPGLFVIKPDEEYSYDGEGSTVPPTRVLKFLAVIYTDFSDDPPAVPADALDDLMDGIDGALAAQPPDILGNGGRQTLGGLVYNCVIAGEPKFFPGDEEGKGGALVPISVTLNQYP